MDVLIEVGVICIDMDYKISFFDFVILVNYYFYLFYMKYIIYNNVK